MTCGRAGILMVPLALITAGVVLGAAPGIDTETQHGGWVRSRPDVDPVSHSAYSEECGACHMAYQPGLLPSHSWVRIMSSDALADHYGDDASLSEGLRVGIANYLVANAADRSRRTRSRAFTVALPSVRVQTDTGLPRITATAYFLRKHTEIPPRLVTDNPEVGRFGQCNRCHLGAAEGVYNEHRVRIPGYGWWED